MFLAETSIQLVPDGTLLLHLLVVVIMVAVLNRTLLKPINSILAERERQIKTNLSEAEQLEANRVETVNKYNSSLREARTEGYQLLERERAEALKQRDEQVRQVKAELKEKVTADREQLHKQEQEALKELETLAVSVSEDISARVFSGPR